MINARWVLLVVILLEGCSTRPPLQKYSGPVGKIERSQLDSVFMAKYDTTMIAPQFIDLIRQAHEGVSIMVFLGTWCPDSRREVPRFLKIADSAGIPMAAITLYAVDRQKKSPEGVEEQYHLELVPTFIFRKDGSEIGRIVESPRTTLEGDMLTILAAAQK